ncbi:hypothetical protein NDU88_002233 [Pleurodeles waltl]|uniref:Uncharacterized protein n=1 Tax=Pleurodeles waltl TaxID=8319 RepID=A0AAV7MQT5_PLEWA|nr:hypothetical protein NDU88_002233 [Pleurodeles waltl]
MIGSLSADITTRFDFSESNQKKIWGMCEDLGKKVDDLADRTAALEGAFSDLKTVVDLKKKEIHNLKAKEEECQVKLADLENNQKRNNLRIINAPEGLHGNYLKAFVMIMIEVGVQVDEPEEVIFRDIQRVPCDPFRKFPSVANQERF